MTIYELADGYRYQAKAGEQNARIADRLIRLTRANRHWDYGLCLLHRRNVKGFGWKHKRVCRRYTEFELNLCFKPRKRIVREQQQVPAAINQMRSMDFIHDQLSNGRSLRLFNVLDNFNHQGLGVGINL